MKKVIFVRDGTAEIVSGRLTSIGRRQAEDIAKLLQPKLNPATTRIIGSKALVCKETAQAVANWLNLADPPEQYEELFPDVFGRNDTAAIGLIRTAGRIAETLIVVLGNDYARELPAIWARTMLNFKLDIPRATGIWAVAFDLVDQTVHFVHNSGEQFALGTFNDT